MAQATPNDGSRQMGFVQVETAMQMLEQALPDLGSNTPEGAAVIKALSVLSSKFNRGPAQQLVPAQITELQKAQQPSPLAGMLAGAGAPPGAAPAPAM